MRGDPRPPFRASALTLIIAAAGAVLVVRNSKHADNAARRAPNIELPPWFGDANRSPVRITGRVLGVSQEINVRIWIDVPDPSIWAGREVRTSSTGEFDFGPMRAGEYFLLASGNGWLSRVVKIDTARQSGDRAELVAYEWKSLQAGLRKSADGQLADPDWARARALSTLHEPQSIPLTMLPITGVVLRSDGRPAASVGVVPIAERHTDHEPTHDMGIVVTTDAQGWFSFLPNDSLSGFRIVMGTRTHDVQVDDQSPTKPVVIRLPEAGAERHGVFGPYRRDIGDARGAWVRGRNRSGHWKAGSSRSVVNS